MMSVGHEERPVWKEHRRPIDDPAANFQRLRGKWSEPKPVRAKTIQPPHYRRDPALIKPVTEGTFVGGLQMQKGGAI